MGVRAEVAVESPEDCPVAAARVSSVDWSLPTDEGRVVEEALVAGDDEDGDGPAALAEAVAADPGSEGAGTLFERPGGSVYRFERSLDRACVCQLLADANHPVADVSSADGRLYVSFRAPDGSAVREAIRALKRAYDGVRLRYLARAGTDEGGIGDPVLVDRSRLTDRQREVLRTAYEMGYFEHPREANATEVAGALGIRPPTFVEHLAAAQAKLLDDVVSARAE